MPPMMLNPTLTLASFSTAAYILPNQTLLIVSGTGTNDVADNRVYNLYQHHRRELGLTNRRSVLLSPSGFYLKLTDKNDDVVDEAGNVMVDGAERTIMWDLPARMIQRCVNRWYVNTVPVNSMMAHADPAG